MKKIQLLGLLLLVGFFAVQGAVRAEGDALSLPKDDKAAVADEKKSDVVKAAENEIIPAPATSEIVKAAEEEKK